VPTVTLAICIRGAGRAFVKFWEGKLLEVHWGNCRPERNLSVNSEILDAQDGHSSRLQQVRCAKQRDL